MVLARVGLLRPTTLGPWTSHDDRRDDGPSGPLGEVCRRVLPARDDRLRRRAADGAGSGRVDRRGAWRAQPRPPGAAQRLPRARLADPGGNRRAADPEAPAWLLLPGLPGAPADGREGADGGDPGSLRPGYFHTLRGR